MDNLTKVTTKNDVTIHIAVILHCILLKKSQFSSLPPKVKLQKYSKGYKLVNYNSKPFKIRLNLLKKIDLFQCTTSNVIAQMLQS
jgi:hypothetical protein